MEQIRSGGEGGGASKKKKYFFTGVLIEARDDAVSATFPFTLFLSAPSYGSPPP